MSLFTNFDTKNKLSDNYRMTEKYKYRNLIVDEGEAGRLAEVNEASGSIGVVSVLNDAIKLAVEKGGHTLSYKGKSVHLKPFQYNPTTLAKALDLDE